MNPESTPALEGRKHSPLPWAVSSSTMIVATDDTRDLAIICNTIDLVGLSSIRMNEARANAAFIVEACNSHALLLAQNAEMLEALTEKIIESDTMRQHHHNAESVAATLKAENEIMMDALRSIVEHGNGKRSLGYWSGEECANRARAALSRNGGKV